MAYGFASGLLINSSTRPLFLVGSAEAQGLCVAWRRSRCVLLPPCVASPAKCRAPWTLLTAFACTAASPPPPVPYVGVRTVLCSGVQNSNNGKAGRKNTHGKERGDGLTGRSMWDGGERCSSPFRKETGNSPPSLFWPSSLSVQHPAWAVTLPRPSVRDPSSALWFGYLVDRLRRSAAAPPPRTSPALPPMGPGPEPDRPGWSESLDGETSGGRGRRRPTGRPHHARARGRPTENEDNFTKPTLASPARRSRWYGGQRRGANCICPWWTVLATRQCHRR